MASANFIDECKQPANCNRYGKLSLINSGTNLTQSDMIQEFTIDDGCYVDGNIIGSVYSKAINVQLIDALDETLEDESLLAQVGLTYIEEIQDEEQEVTEYIDLGKFTIEKPNDELTDNYTSFTGYDDLINNLDKKYESSLDYENNTITLSDLYNDVCSNLGLTPKTLSFLNDDIEIEENPFVGGETNRFVLQTICKVSASFVNIDYEDNEIDLCWLSSSANPDYTFSLSDYSTVNGGKVVYGPVNSLIIKSASVESENVSVSDAESIALYGEHQLVIADDYILHTPELRQQAITDIWTRVHNLTYVDCELTTYYGKPFLKIGDKIRVYTDDNTYFDTYVLQHEFTYDGAFRSIIKSPVMTEQQVQTKQDMSLGEKLSQTYIDVNKQKGEIEAVVEKTEQLDLAVGNNYAELTEKFNGYTPLSTTIDLQNSVQNIQTNAYTKTQVNQILKGEFYDDNNNQIVSEIVKTASGTFDINGMTYEKTDSNTKTTINEVGVNVRDLNNNSILFAGYVDANNTEYPDFKGQTIVASENIQVKNYFVMPDAHSRIEKYENGGGMFYV